MDSMLPRKLAGIFDRNAHRVASGPVERLEKIAVECRRQGDLLDGRSRRQFGRQGHLLRDATLKRCAAAAKPTLSAYRRTS